MAIVKTGQVTSHTKFYNYLQKNTYLRSTGKYEIYYLPYKHVKKCRFSDIVHEISSIGK
jgi:hypothetical protein